MRSRLLAIAALPLALACDRSPAAPESMAVPGDLGPMLVKYGELDGSRHPYVGLMVAQDANGNPLWRCSGALLNDRIFLTAGHCTESPAARVEIWFAADVESGIPANGYPFTGEVSGTPHTHPQYNPNAFFLFDLGVVVLSRSFPMSAYAALPTLDVLDAMATLRGKWGMACSSSIRFSWRRSACACCPRRI
jgi:hypothetical protein